MVGRGQRQLSILLIATIAMSWLAVPTSLLAVETNTSGDLKKTVGKNECDTGYNPEIDISTLFSKSTLIAFKSKCFSYLDDNKQLLNKFRLIKNGQEVFYNVRYNKETTIKAYPGCSLETKGSQANKEELKLIEDCKKGKIPIKNLYFSFTNHPQITEKVQKVQDDRYYGEFTSPKITQIIKVTSSQTADLWVPVDVNNSPFWRLSGEPQYLIALNNTIYGFFTANKNNNQQDPLDDFIKVSNPLTGQRGGAYIIRDYIHHINQELHSIGSSGFTVPTGSKSQDDFFKNIIKTKLNRLDNIKLEDDPMSPSGEPPALPPIIELSVSGDKIIFKLDSVIRARNESGRVQNNYFLFKLAGLGTKKVTGNTQAVLNNLGGENATERIYLAIDLMGNIGFLLNGLDGKDFNATSTTVLDHWTISGGFDANNGDASRSKGGPGRINLADYRKTITKRVYNEPGDKGVSICGKIINFGEENELYVAPLVIDNIPNQDQRECINVSEGGWLNVWGITDVDLNKSGNDNNCINAFGGEGLFGLNLMGKAICFFIGTVINMAVWFAGFTVEFLIEVVGLQ